MQGILKFIVNIPWTVLGIFAAQSCGIKSLKRENAILVFTVRRIWFADASIRGITLGHAILIKDEKHIDRKLLLAHERVHVEQYDRLLGFFPFIYLCEQFWQMFHTLWFAAYNNNRFEKEARERAQRSD